MTRVIKARTLVELQTSQVGRLISYRDNAPERLESAYPLLESVVLIFRRHHGKHAYWVEEAVTKDTEITIHDEP